VYHHTHLIDWDGATLTFSLGWPWISVLLISTLQVDRITGISYHAWPQNMLFQILGEKILHQNYSTIQQGSLLLLLELWLCFAECVLCQLHVT
jgi:hypothetical protein